MEEKLNYSQFKQQDLNTEFGNVICIGYRREEKFQKHPEVLKALLENLAANIVEGVYRQGYKPKTDTSKFIIKTPSSGATADPTNLYGTVGGTIKCDLKATKGQFLVYASEAIDELNKHLIYLQELSAGDVAENILVKKLDERFPCCQLGDSEDYDKAYKKIEKLTQRIDIMVKKLEGSLFVA